MAYPTELYDSDLNIAHPALLKSQQQFIKSTYSLLPGLSLGRHLFTLPLLCTVILLQLAISAVIKHGLFRSSNIEPRIALLERERPMAKTKPTSLDGRSQKLSKPAWKPKEQPGPSLRPASPPKQNPWRQRQASVASDQEKPAKPLELKVEEFPVLSTPEKDGKEERQEKAADTTSSEKPNLPESCDASSKASSSTNETQSEDTRSGVSRLSTPTRLILEEAADQAAKILWRHPFGSNVYLYAEGSMFQLHRDILTRHSGWFREKLPPLNEDGSPVEMHLPHAIGAVQPCLYFMYTKNIDICERDSVQPLNFLHVPRCVLAYCAAVNFQIPSMAVRILAILEETARHLTSYLSVHYIYRDMDFKTSKSVLIYFVNSVDILYSEPLFELMKPIRHALAGILDALLPYMLRQPSFPEIMNLPSWKRWSAAIAADQVEYRTALGRFRSPEESNLPSETEMEALFDRVLGQYHRDQQDRESMGGSCDGDSNRGEPEELEKDQRNLRNPSPKKKRAIIPEFIQEEPALECQAPSIAGSTDSETSTWNSLGTDDFKARQRGNSASSSLATHDFVYAKSNSSAGERSCKRNKERKSRS
ncbi:uncharacterized protein TrAFT101_003375 [Trichoderma asperellum]|uniref:BTB domain-containing protein n=1 Tax=Trichoderma asperellum (strain ATCC 204424 / CBS 433.97 / NBRC 101777) TaxID=1042311 RepID=A0A2T3ZQW3_TRIA4|nr:hypothetical protein M441DRAFT_126593 [Trichoderma asperellum CBS 433.97]PTB47193.1 hypothetical protein M441DRAFT_126593 [Trichoderma asperellum CBS 433.97]UKZ87586.1 hypothetical protein TrAFT101_003375 [Trichoderma asperellum]